MEKPKPQELVIEDISNEKVSRLLRLTWASPAAKAWAEANAKEFGNALDPGIATHPGEALWLFVAPTYNTGEVLAYLRHAWAEAQSPVQWPESIS